MGTEGRWSRWKSLCYISAPFSQSNPWVWGPCPLLSPVGQCCCPHSLVLGQHRALQARCAGGWVTVSSTAGSSPNTSPPCRTPPSGFPCLSRLTFLFSAGWQRRPLRSPLPQILTAPLLSPPHHTTPSALPHPQHPTWPAPPLTPHPKRKKKENRKHKQTKTQHRAVPRRRRGGAASPSTAWGGSGCLVREPRRLLRPSKSF